MCCDMLTEGGNINKKERPKFVPKMIWYFLQRLGYAENMFREGWVRGKFYI